MRRAQYQSTAKAFRTRLKAEAKKPKDQQVWPDETEWLSFQGTATCTTPTCGVVGVTFPVTLYENADGNYRVSCGRCGASINPVVDLED